MILQAIGLFIVGIVENFLLALNIKFLQRNRKLHCFIVSYFGILVWYYIISTVVENLHIFVIIHSYALGFASGDVLAIYFNQYLERIAKSKGLKLRVKRDIKRQGRKK